MKLRTLRWLGLFALLVAASDCNFYSGIAKQGNQIYLTGYTNYGIAASTWVKRCIEQESELVCEKLSVNDVASGTSTAVASESLSDEEAKQELRAAIESRREMLLSCSGRPTVTVKAIAKADRTLDVRFTDDLSGSSQEQCARVTLGAVPLTKAKPGDSLMRKLP
jgi:hypothetical protein